MSCRSWLCRILVSYLFYFRFLSLVSVFYFFIYYSIFVMGLCPRPMGPSLDPSLGPNQGPKLKPTTARPIITAKQAEQQARTPLDQQWRSISNLLACSLLPCRFAFTHGPAAALVCHAHARIAAPGKLSFLPCKPCLPGPSYDSSVREAPASLVPHPSSLLFPMADKLCTQLFPRIGRDSRPLSSTPG